jgi:hypothetical protein
VAYPIFAFLIVEGYFHTHDLRRYLLRLLAFALVSEVPFDLMYDGTVFYPFHQNVLWTFLIALLGIWLMEKARATGKTWAYALAAVGVVAVGYLLGIVTMADYYGMGVLTVFVFYFFRGRSWWCLLGQVLALYWVNVIGMGGRVYPVTFLGLDMELSQQGLALLALIPIWLYRGRQGYHSKAFQYVCYAFYPVHMLVLSLLDAR